MNEILKKPYKITLWEDRNIYIVNGQKKIQLENDDEVQNQYFEEVCIATIGSDTMDTPIRAFNPILTEELNGSKTLTFQIYYRYWDDEEEEFKLNPFINLLVNERKVKLKYDNNWYDFVIKGIQEDSENYTFTYTCSDLFINELGKTGYEVELDTELQNNMGTVKELANYILEGTDWSEYNSETLIQKNKEVLYIYRTSENNTLTAVDMLDSTHTLSANQLKDKAIYVFYSCKANNEPQPQFLYVEGNPSTVEEAREIYKIDKDGFITNSSNWLLSGSINYDDLIPSQYFGQKIIQKQRMKYIPQIGETCTVWEDENDNQYYCYTELEYASVSEIQNMLVNSTSFVTPDGWTIANSNSSVDVETYTVSDGHGSNTTHHSLRVQGTVENSGFFDNKTSLAPSGIIAGEPYIVALKAAINNGISNIIDNSKITSPKVYGVSNVNANQNGNLITFNSSENGTGVLDGYKIFKGSAIVSKSYQEIVNNFSQLLFQFQTTITNGVSDIVNLLDIKLFKERHDKNGNLIVPDLEESYSEIPQEDISEETNPAEEGWYEYDSTNGYTPTEDTSPQPNTDYYSIYNSIIKTRYNFFPTDTDLSNVYSKESLAFSDTFLLEEGTTLEEHGYNPVLVENYEKVTSITGSKSNRFNLIQSLCEAFECWAKFTIEHDSKGRILYEYIPINQDEYIVGGRYYQRIDGNSGVSSDDSKFSIYTGNSYINGLYKKVYHKYVTFKEFIGQENPVGFRYGINLKSIQRDIVSDQIASKVIVQPNTNEFAPNGSCTIQQALLNPTGENALYNFQYFINHGLLDTVALYDDLYGTNGGLGFFVKMREYNDQIREPINELGLISNTVNRLESRQIVYDALAEEADNLYDEAGREITAAGYSDGGTTGVDYIDALIKNRESYQSTKNYYSSISASNKSLLENYQARYNAINSSLSEILVKKNKLNSDFHKKYYSFIQEGTWTSNEYFDPEFYYQAANMVLYTSSFPQVSYTINVLELSQVEGFEPYRFKIADKTYIEDVEFFGYDYKNRPYKEEIVISEIRTNLDDPSQNTITVQNYKTQFQDLFQRIAATSQSLQYNEGAYNRAASAINDDGTINSALLQNSLRDNELIIQNAKNQSVNWDETGITISNFVNANEIVRLTSGGIVLSSDGGQSWTTGITGTGINADVITTGRLDTNRIRIFNNNMQTFEWNSKGINAFAQTTTGNVTQTDFSKFVRFDQYGLYGYSGSANWDPEVETNSVVGINKVIRDSVFSLTWKGLKINLSSGQGFSAIDNPTGNPKSQGWYEYNSTNHNYEKTTDTSVQSGKAYYENNDVVINVNDNFTVDGAGNVNLSGNINLTDGSIIWGSNMPQTNVTSQNVYDAISSGVDSGEPFYGLFYTNNNGLYLNASAIKTGTLNASDVTITNLNASNITAGTLNVDRIAAKTITGAKLVNATIEDEKIAYRTIENASIASDAINARTIAAHTITADEIDTGYINIIVGDSSYGGLSIASGNDGKGTTTGIKMYGSDDDYYIIATNRGVRMTADESHSIYVTSSGCYADGSAITSDRNLKDNINYDLSQYEPFMKEIKPCSFVFKTEPNKISFGFIAQDIESLLLKNNFNKDNFSILNILETDNGDKYFLSYNDFIALQQWQIQKLESRISALENLISS